MLIPVFDINTSVEATILSTKIIMPFVPSPLRSFREGGAVAEAAGGAEMICRLRQPH